MPDNLLHPAVVIEYLGDRDKTITPSATVIRIFTENPAFNNKRVIVETDPLVLKFCEGRPSLFRRRPDLEASITRKETLKDMAENVEDYVDVFYEAIKSRLVSDGSIDDPNKKTAKKTTK